MQKQQVDLPCGGAASQGAKSDTVPASDPPDEYAADGDEPAGARRWSIRMILGAAAEPPQCCSARLPSSCTSASVGKVRSAASMMGPMLDNQPLGFVAWILLLVAGCWCFNEMPNVRPLGGLVRPNPDMDFQDKPLVAGHEAHH
jgi:hypothetical protein